MGALMKPRRPTKEEKAVAVKIIEKAMQLVDVYDDAVAEWAYCQAQMVLWLRSQKGSHPWEGAYHPPSEDFIRGWDECLESILASIAGGLVADVDDEAAITKLAREIEEGWS
jgi:hypothetical protein